MDELKVMPNIIYQAGTYTVASEMLAAEEDDNVCVNEYHVCQRDCWCYGKTLYFFEPIGHGHSIALSRFGVSNIGESYASGTEKHAMRSIIPKLIEAKITNPVFANEVFLEVDFDWRESKTTSAKPRTDDDQKYWQLAFGVLIYDGARVYTRAEFSKLDSGTVWFDRCVPLMTIGETAILHVHKSWPAYRRQEQLKQDALELAALD